MPSAGYEGLLGEYFMISPNSYQPFGDINIQLHCGAEVFFLPNILELKDEIQKYFKRMDSDLY